MSDYGFTGRLSLQAQWPNAYVGRGDSDVIGRMRRSHAAARYDLTVTVYETTRVKPEGVVLQFAR